MKQLFATFREDDEEQKQLNIEAAKRSVNKTEAEKKLLIDEGYDDFVRGGKTASPVGDILGVGGSLAAGYAAIKNPITALGVVGVSDPTSPNFTKELSMDMVMNKGLPINRFRGAKRIGKLITEVFSDQIESSGYFFNQLFQKPNIVKQAEEVFSGRLFGVTGGDFPTSSGFVPPTPKQVYDTKQKLMTNQLADASGRLNIWNYFKNKKGRSNWGRLMAKEVQTLPHTRESWTRIKNELQNDFLSIYPEKFLKTVKYKNAKGKLVPLSKDSIEVEHIFTLQQSMPIFANVEWGGDVWQSISRRILSKQFALGDTRQNLIAVPEHIHRIKSQYFNKMAGIDGRKFFTDDVIKEMIADTNFRNAKIDEWLKEVEKGKKIIDDGLTIWETLYKGKPIPPMPEELVERLASIDLDNADIEKIIPQIFEDFRAEGFTTDAWNVKELRAKQLEIDAKDVKATEKIIDKEIKSNPKKYNKPYKFGMRDQDLRDRAEAAWEYLRKNKLKFEGEIQTSIFDAENKEKWIKFTMKSILNQSKRNFK